MVMFQQQTKKVEIMLLLRQREVMEMEWRRRCQSQNTKREKKQSQKQNRNTKPKGAKDLRGVHQMAEATILWRTIVILSQFKWHRIYISSHFQLRQELQCLSWPITNPAAATAATFPNCSDLEQILTITHMMFNTQHLEPNQIKWRALMKGCVCNGMTSKRMLALPLEI